MSVARTLRKALLLRSVHDGIGRQLMTGRLSALLNLQSNQDGSIAVTVSSPHGDERISVDDAALVLTLWAESADLVRGTFADPTSGVVAYFQSGDASFQRLARTIKLAITS